MCYKCGERTVDTYGYEGNSPARNAALHFSKIGLSEAEFRHYWRVRFYRHLDLGKYLDEAVKGADREVVKHREYMNRVDRNRKFREEWDRVDRKLRQIREHV